MLLGKVLNFKFQKFQKSNQIPSYLSESKFEGDQKAQRVPLFLKLKLKAVYDGFEKVR